MKMKSTMTYKKWDIVFVPFPFTDLTVSKKRPALVVSPNEYNLEKDVVIAFITSKIHMEKRLGDYKIKDWTKASLPKPSTIRMKFATIDQSIIVRKLGRLTKNDTTEFNDLLIDFFGK